MLAGCIKIPDIPTMSHPPSSSGDAIDYIDEAGCFPVDCDLPPGMKELCQAFQAGTISWPEPCSLMPGEACQLLCTQEKAASGLDLPTTVIDGYQVGWMRPIQLDDNIKDSGRPQFGWGLVTPVVDHDGRVLLVYGGLVNGPSYYRYCDGNVLSDPVIWNGPDNNWLRIFDSDNLLHLISVANMGEEEQHLVHTTWDGTTFISEPVFPGQFVKPTLSRYNLAIDNQDRLHLAFWDKSRGVREVWYTRYDENGWSQPVCVSNSVSDSWDPSLDVLDDGRVFISWHESPKDSMVESTTAPTMFTWFDGKHWSTPSLTALGSSFPWIGIDNQGIVHQISENVYTYWDGERWSDTLQIDYPGQATAMYHAIIDPNDNLHVIWNRYNKLESPTPDGRQFSREMMYRRRSADGTWSPVASLGIWDTSPTYNEVHTMLVIDAGGVIHTSFWGNIEGNVRQYYLNSGAPIQDSSLFDLVVMPPQPSYKQYTFPEPKPVATVPSTAWSEVSSLGLSIGGEQAANIDLATDSSGRLHVVWQEPQGDGYEIMYSSTDGSTWSDAINLSNSGSFNFVPVIAIDAGDGIHVGWIGSIPGSTGTFHTFFDGNAWSPPEKISRVVNWRTLSSMVDVTIKGENTTRPAIAAGSPGEAAMAWEHISEGISNAVAFAVSEDSRWQPEAFPIEDSHLPYAGDRASIDFDSQGNLHLTFTYSGTIDGFDEGVYLKGQPFYTRYDGSTWSEPAHLLSIRPDPNPGDQWSFMTSVTAASPERVLIAFTMRPFEPEYFPYRLPNENSNVYLTFWDGQSWSEARRLDSGTAFGPSHVDIAMDADGLAHIVWSKYDSYSKRYSIYYATSDGKQENETVLIWRSDQDQESFPILKPNISVDASGGVTIFFEAHVDGFWRGFITTKP